MVGATLLTIVGTFGSAACGPVPPDGSGGAGGTGGPDPYGPYREGFTPAPNNPPECPKGAPANPIGSCAGLPVYLACNYTNGTVNYGCICDWVHWLCL
jgi:hypothetical protein